MSIVLRVCLFFLSEKRALFSCVKIQCQVMQSFPVVLFREFKENTLMKEITDHPAPAFASFPFCSWRPAANKVMLSSHATEIIKKQTIFSLQYFHQIFESKVLGCKHCISWKEPGHVGYITWWIQTIFLQTQEFPPTKHDFLASPLLQQHEMPHQILSLRKKGSWETGFQGAFWAAVGDGKIILCGQKSLWKP